MSIDASPNVRSAPIAALLAALASYPLAAVSRPAEEPTGWVVLVAVVVAIAAAAGSASEGVERTTEDGPAGRIDPSSGWVAIAGLALLGCGADVVIRLALRTAAGEPIDPTVLGPGTLVVAALVVAGWSGGRWFARNVREATSGRVTAPTVRRVGIGLLVVGAAALAAGGWLDRGPSSTQWTVSAGVILGYVLAASIVLVWLRRTALLVAWRRTGRAWDPTIADRWRRWAVLLSVGLLVLLVAWFAPAAEPARDAADRFSAGAWEAVDRLGESGVTRDEIERGPAGGGEGLTGRDPSVLDDDRATSTVEELVEWLLRPAAGFGEGEPRVGDGPRPESVWEVAPQLALLTALAVAVLAIGFLVLRRREVGSWVLAVLSAWWTTLRDALQALLRAGRKDANLAGGPAEEREAAQPRPRRPSVGSWRRPSDPRAQVRYDYLRVLRDAERRGVPRRGEETPVRYARVLRPMLDEHGEALDELTDIYVEARYSHHRVTARTAEQTREMSRNLRRELKNVSVTERA